MQTSYKNQQLHFLILTTGRSVNWIYWTSCCRFCFFFKKLPQEATEVKSLKISHPGGVVINVDMHVKAHLLFV